MKDLIYLYSLQIPSSITFLKKKKEYHSGMAVHKTKEIPEL